MIQRLIIGIITVLLAGIIGYTVYTNVNKGKEENNGQVVKEESSLPAPTRVPAQTETEKPVDKVKIFFIALNDGGKKGKVIGCGDSVVAVEKTITPTREPLAAALETLLAAESQTDPASGLYNAFYQSDLTLEKVEIGKGGQANIYLLGNQAISGVCDDPRIIAQLTETALQFSSISQVQLYINGYPIEQLLSGSGM